MAARSSRTGFKVVALGLVAGLLLSTAPVRADEPIVKSLAAYVHKGKAMVTLKVPPGTVKGKVLARDHITPLAHAKITVVDANTRKIVLTTTTNDAGEFSLSDLPVGKYIVTVGETGSGLVLDVVEGAPAATVTVLMTLRAGLAAISGPTAIVGGVVIAGGVTGAILVASSGGPSHRHVLSPIKP